MPQLSTQQSSMWRPPPSLGCANRKSTSGLAAYAASHVYAGRWQQVMLACQCHLQSLHALRIYNPASCTHVEPDRQDVESTAICEPWGTSGAAEPLSRAPRARQADGCHTSRVNTREHSLQVAESIIMHCNGLWYETLMVSSRKLACCNMLRLTMVLPTIYTSSCCVPQ